MGDSTYQSNKNAEELDDICVGYRIQAAHQGVEGGDECRDDDRRMHVHVDDHADGGS